MVCRLIKPRPGLIRLVKQKDWTRARLDPDGRTPGRGLYICREGDCVSRFLKERKLRKRYHRTVEEQTLGTLEKIIGGIDKTQPLQGEATELTRGQIVEDKEGNK